MSDTGPAKMSAFSFNSHPGMLSGPLVCTGSTLIVSCGLTQPIQKGGFQSSYEK